MKKLIYLILFCLLVVPCSAQTYVAMVRPGGAMWGYVNIKGEMIIPAQYSNCQSFTEDGYAAYADVKNHLFFLIDLKGEKLKTQFPTFKMLVHPGFAFESFHSGMLPISIDDKWGYMGTNGKLVTPLNYDNAYEFSDGYGVAKRDGKFDIIDSIGKATPVTDPTVRLIRKFSEGLAPYQDDDRKFGFITPDGKVAIKATFENVGYFSAGLAWARASDKKIGYINHQGEWVIKPQFLVVNDFDPMSGMAMVRQTDQWIYTNLRGEISHPPALDLIQNFSEGLAIGKKNGLVGFLDNKGAWAIPPKFEGARDFKNGYAAVKLLGLWGVIGKDGNWVIKPTFSAMKDMELIPDH